MDSKIFQGHSTRMGHQFSELCKETLRGQGWSLRGPERIDGIGVTVDQVAYTKNGTKVFFEFNGSVNGHQPGMKRTSAFRQALAKAFLTRQFDKSPFVVMTSHLPDPKTVGARSIQVSKKEGVIQDVLGVFEREDVKKLEYLLNNA
jgi:hypothetical protein